MTRMERRLAELEAELDAARTASELRVVARYYMQMKAAVAREQAHQEGEDRPAGAV